MILIEDAELKRWTPDFSSSGQGNPLWIRLEFHGITLCNSLEWAEWADNPVQVEICDKCGIVRCATGGYVHVSRIGEYILWTRPRYSNGDRGFALEYAPSSAVSRFGSLAFPTATWEGWRQQVSLLTVGALALTTGEVVADLWLDGIPQPFRCHTLADVLPMLRRDLLGADTMETDMAIGAVEQVISLFDQSVGKPFEGSLMRVPKELGAVEKLYLDGPPCEEWPAFASVAGDLVPLVSPEWALVLG